MALRDGGVIAAELLKDIGVPVFPAVAPQEQPAPFVVYSVNGGASPRTIDGRGDVNQQPISIDVYGGSRGEASTIAETAIAAIEGKRGNIAGMFLQGTYQQPTYSYRTVIKRDGSGKFYHVTSFTHRFTFNGT